MGEPLPGPPRGCPHARVTLRVLPVVVLSARGSTPAKTRALPQQSAA